eukprot:4662992-Prymnesium_polylepis.1
MHARANDRAHRRTAANPAPRPSALLTPWVRPPPPPHRHDHAAPPGRPPRAVGVCAGGRAAEPGVRSRAACRLRPDVCRACSVGDHLGCG